MSTALQNPRVRNRSRPQHVPGRGGYASAVHYRRETPEPEPPQPSQTSQSSNSPVRGIYNDPRTVMILCSFVGTQTSVKTRNGDRYKGHTVSFSEKGDIAMLDVKADAEHTKNPKQPGMIITKDDFVVCKTNGVDFKGLFTSSSDFTDSGIASRMNGSTEASMKVLQPWHDDDAPDTNSSFLDDQSEGWDSTSMFQANRDKFNVKSTYNEDLHEYTTKLPDPSSEGYEEKEKFAQRHAEAIERSEIYQARIAKELKDGDEESLFSSVHRGGNDPGAHSSRHQESNSSSGKNNYIAPGLREESEQTMRNDTYRTQGRGPLHSGGHPQQQPQHSHQNMQQAARQINNQFHSSPPAGGPLNRNQGPSSLHQRPQNHAAHLHHPAQQYQQPPPLHPGMQQHVPPGVSQHHQQQRPPPHHHQQPVSPGQHPSKPHPPHSYSQNIPPTPAPLPSQSHQLPAQTQHPPPQKMGPQYKQSSIQQPASIRGSNVNGPLGPPQGTQDIRQTVPVQNNKEVEKCAEVSSPTSQVESQQIYHQKPPVTGPPPVSSPAGGHKVPEAHMSASSSSSSLVDAQQAGSHPVPAAAQSATAPDRRVSRGAETSPEERNKIGQSLHDFQKNFVLESNGGVSQEPVRQDGIIDSSTASTSPTTSNVGTTTATTAPEASVQLTEQAAEVLAKAESLEDSLTAPKFKLNPNAKEFKPKTQPVQIETQSPSPQPRSSPHMPQMVHYPPQQTVLVPYPYIMANPLATAQRKRATVSLGAGVVSDLAAHQVTGQPLLATQPHHSMMYLQPTGQALPPAYQFYSSPMISPRMVAPGSLTMAQAGQVAGLDQTGTQHQPQPVFITTQQQPMHTPIPAHLHPQPAHAQAITLPPTSQQAQPAHVPNPVPSPVQHQQQNSQPMPQPMPHHISQGPPQSSATPQPAHYPQMTVNYTHGMPAVPRTSMSGQQSLTAGHSSVNFISAPQFQYNGGAAQYTFAHAPQPQTSQNSSHGPGPQHQYVIMPQPSTQGHPPMQQHTAQPYTGTGIPFQPQQHFMQGPPHMPPNHTQNPAQNSSHMMHPGLSANLHQQVTSSQPNMYMQVPSTLQQYQHQQ